jgi:hypothetical protein
MVELGLVCLLSHALLLAVMTLLVVFNVAATLENDIVGALPGLVNFSNGLNMVK